MTRSLVIPAAGFRNTRVIVYERAVTDGTFSVDVVTSLRLLPGLVQHFIAVRKVVTPRLRGQVYIYDESISMQNSTHCCHALLSLGSRER